MTSRSPHLLVVQLITSARVASAIIFAATAVDPTYKLASLVCYVFGLFTDAVDGFAARRLQVSSSAGAAYDGFADKAITVVSALYGAALGAPLVACTLVLLRDLFVLSFRAIAGEHILMPPSRIRGSITGGPLKLLTIIVLCTRIMNPHFTISLSWYWIPGGVSALSLSSDIWVSRGAIATYFRDHAKILRR